MPAARPASHSVSHGGELMSYLSPSAERVLTHREPLSDSQRDLQASEDHFSDTLDAVNDLVVVHDAETGAILAVNSRVQETFGFSSERMASLTVADLCTGDPPFTPQRAKQLVTQALEEGPQLFEWQTRRQDGEMIWMEVNLKSATIGGRRCVLAVGRDMTERRRAREELQENRDELAASVRYRTAELERANAMLREVLSLQEQERQLVTFEIHDGFVQYVNAAIMQLEAFRARHRAAATGGDAEMLDEGLRLLRKSIAEARRLMYSLRPPILDEYGVVPAIEHFVFGLQDTENRDIEFTHDIEFDRLASPLENAIFRVAQEAVHNACRHSGSGRIAVSLIQNDGHVRVTVEDWGVGFDVQESAGDRFGLRGIRERARLFGGEATIDSVPGQGTRVCVELPVVELDSTA